MKENLDRVYQELLAFCCAFIPTPEEGYAKAPHLVNGDLNQILKIVANLQISRNDWRACSEKLAEALTKEVSGLHIAPLKSSGVAIAEFDRLKDTSHQGQKP